MIGEVVAVAAVLHDLSDERGVIVDRRGAFHLAPLHDFCTVRGVVEELRGADVLRVLPHIGRLALVIVPPAAGAALGGGAQVLAVRFHPCLRRARGKTVTADDAAARIGGMHHPQDALEVGV